VSKGDESRAGRSIAGRHLPRMGKDEWLTPPEIVSSVGPFDLDPCSPVKRPWATARRHYTVIDDGLRKPWKGRVWCNPPYGRETPKWLKRCREHGNAIALVFARTETRMWIEDVWGSADAVLFLFGRLHFYNVDGTRAPANAGGPSALIAYGRENAQSLSSAGIAGQIVELTGRRVVRGVEALECVC
jgi:hypothetical protein